MSEIRVLTVIAALLRAHVRDVRAMVADPERRDAGEIVQTVIIIGAFAIAAIAIVAVIVAKVTAKANSIKTE